MIRICEQVKYLNREQGGKPVVDGDNYTLTWYACLADARAQTNPITV